MPVKSKPKISQNFVAFSDYMNFSGLVIREKHVTIMLLTLTAKYPKNGGREGERERNQSLDQTRGHPLASVAVSCQLGRNLKDQGPRGSSWHLPPLLSSVIADPVRLADLALRSWLTVDLQL